MKEKLLLKYKINDNFAQIYDIPNKIKEENTFNHSFSWTHLWDYNSISIIRW